MKAKNGFTLVEVLVVVTVIGVLATIVVPQFKDVSKEAKTSTLCADLRTVRVAIELYRIQHKWNQPGSVAGVSFEQALTEKTEADGTLNPAGRCGPYVQKIPANPFNNLATVEIDGVVGGGDHGWDFATSTGQFHADTDDHLSL